MRRNDLEHKGTQNDLQSKKMKYFSICLKKKVVYNILTERAPGSLALGEISTTESLKAGESEHQRVVLVQKRKA